MHLFLSGLGKGKLNYFLFSLEVCLVYLFFSEKVKKNVRTLMDNQLHTSLNKNDSMFSIPIHLNIQLDVYI